MDSMLALADGEVEVLIGVDLDDPARLSVPAGCQILEFDGVGSSKKVWELARRSTGDAMRVVSNDEEFLTRGWDAKLYREWEADPYWCLYTNDKRGENTGGRCPIVTREWYEVAGYYPPHFWHWHADKWVTDIAEVVGRLRYVPSVDIRHWHPKTRLGGAKRDDVYRRRGDAEPELWKRTEPERRLLAERLQEAICARS